MLTWINLRGGRRLAIFKVLFIIELAHNGYLFFSVGFWYPEIAVIPMIIQWRNFFKNKDLNLQYNPTTVKRWAWRRKNWACPLLLSYEKVEISSIRSMMHNCYGHLVQELYRNRDYSKHLCLPPLLPRRLGFMGTVCFGEWHPKHPHGSPGKAVKIFWFEAR